MDPIKHYPQIDAEGWFGGLAVAYASPLEPGVYHLPRGAVDLPAPDVPQGQRARLVDGAWAFFLPPAIETAPPVPATLEELRARARERVNAWRDAQEAGAILFLHADRVWDGGLSVRMRLVPLLSLPAMPPGMFWTDADDNDVPVDLALLTELHDAHELAIVTRGFEIHVRQRAMKAEIEAMDAAQLQAFAPDWPALPEPEPEPEAPAA